MSSISGRLFQHLYSQPYSHGDFGEQEVLKMKDKLFTQFIKQNFKIVFSVLFMWIFFIGFGDHDPLMTVFKDIEYILQIGILITFFMALAYVIIARPLTILGWYGLIFTGEVPKGCIYHLRESAVGISNNPRKNDDPYRLTMGEKNRIREALREVDLYQYSNEHRWLKKDKK